MIDSLYSIPPYTLRIRSIFRIGGTIYRNERKTDARVLASAQNGFVTRRRDFLKKMHRTRHAPSKLKTLVYVNKRNKETR